MPIDLVDLDDELYSEWICRMYFELDLMRKRRELGVQPKMNCRNTFQIILQYSSILKNEIHFPVDIMAFFRIFVESLINPLRKPTVLTDEIDLRPCELWERFAEYYLRFINVDFLPLSSEKKVTHTGKRNDRGVDVICEWHGERAVVQVKRGFFFKKGKGTEIVLKLIGSMVIFDARFGIIFTNESYKEDVKADARAVILMAKQRNLMIFVLDLTEINCFAERDAQSCKRLMIEFIDDFLPLKG